MFFSILRVCIVYSVEQVPCGSCRAGCRDLLAGDMGSDNLFPSAGATGLAAAAGGSAVGPVSIS